MSDLPHPPRFRISRRKALALLLAGAGTSVIDAFCIEPGWLGITRTDITCPGLAQGLDGIRIGVLSDIHYKPDSDEALLEAAVTRMLEEKPDLILLPGDFVDHSTDVVAPMMRILSRLNAPQGVFACMGNHDGWSGAGPILQRSFDRSGFTFLVNQHTRLQVRGESLAVAATDHIWLGRPDPERTLRGIPNHVPIIGMIHEPDFFDRMIESRPMTLQISGHTHGGQCQVPLLGYAPARVKYGEKYLNGVYEHGDARLFVSRGLGTTGMRVRFACRPEVAILTLRAVPA
jgi:predicted MPP superfamily phosphohydrolase